MNCGIFLACVAIVSLSMNCTRGGDGDELNVNSEEGSASELDEF